MKDIQSCPVCESTSFKDFLDVKDHMITQEVFKIVVCDNCGFHFTNPVPDASVISKYYKSEKYISHSSSKKGFTNFLYHIVRKRTLKDKVNWIKKETDGKRLLDIGSGSGHFLNVANKNGFNVDGLEPDDDARKFAKKHNNIEAKPQSELYNIENNTYDVVTMWHVLEHVYELRKDVQRISEIIKTNGKLFVALPNMNGFDAHYYNHFWSGYDVPRHLYHFKKEDIIRLMEQFNFKFKKVIPMKYDAYYISMLSEKYRKRLSIFGIIIGFVSNAMHKKYGYASQVYVFKKLDK